MTNIDAQFVLSLGAKVNNNYKCIKLFMKNLGGGITDSLHVGSAPIGDLVLVFKDPREYSWGVPYKYSISGKQYTVGRINIVDCTVGCMVYYTV